MSEASRSGAWKWVPTARDAQVALRVLSLLLIIGLVVPFVVYAIPGAIGAEGSYVVLSGSMEPAIETGSVVFVYHTEPATIGPGEVVTYRMQGMAVPTTHRVTDVIYTNDVESGVIFRTKGDANEDPDQSLVPGAAVLGVVPTVTVPGVGPAVFRLPFMGHLIQFANTDLGFVLLVGLPLVAFILNEVWGAATGSNRVARAAQTTAREDSATTSEATADTAYGTEESATEEADGLQAHSEPPGDIHPGTFELDHADLKATLIVMALAAIYATVVAFVVFTPWSISIAVAAGGSVLYLAAIRHRALRDAAAGSGSQGAHPIRSVADGGKPMARPEKGYVPFEVTSDTTNQIRVDSLEALQAVLGQGDSAVDGQDGVTAVFIQAQDRVYTFEPDTLPPTRPQRSTPLEEER